MHRRLPVLLVMAIGTAVLCSCQEQNALDFAVRLDRAAVTAGDPVLLECPWTNLSDTPLTIGDWRGPLTGVCRLNNDEKNPLYDLSVHSETGARLPYRGMFRCGPTATIRLQPRETLTRTYDVSQAYDLAAVGRYALRAAYHSDASTLWGHSWRGLLVHPDRPLEVVTRDT